MKGAPEYGPAARRRSRQVLVGHVAIGGDAPIVVQSMTNTDTADVAATVAQVAELVRAGSELVRVTVNNAEAAAAVPLIRERLDARGIGVPLVGDFHFNGHRLLAQHPACAEALAKLRINPGNVGRGAKRDEQFATLIEVACRLGKPVRIGVNWGSLDQDLLTRMMDENSRAAEPMDALEVLREATVVSALASAARAEELGLPHDAIVISSKVSGVQDLVAIYRALAARCDYPLHLGLTEAGMGAKGIVSSAAALAILLQEGIGDTIRVSLTPEPGGDRTLEVKVAQELLQTMGFRAFVPAVAACPGCGRTTSTLFQELARDIQDHIAARMPVWRESYPGVEAMQVAVMGCIVNGPGESKHADIGISLPGTGEAPAAPVFIDGRKAVTLRGPTLARDFKQLVEDYVERRFGTGAAKPDAVYAFYPGGMGVNFVKQYAQAGLKEEVPLYGPSFMLDQTVLKAQGDAALGLYDTSFWSATLDNPENQRFVAGWKKEYGGRIIHQLKRLGASCDWDRERFTLDEGLSRAVREAFVHLYEKGLIYRGPRLINWSPGLKTAVSDLEVEYSEEDATLYYFKYMLKDSAEFIPVATIRPETILGDTAVAVHPDDERYKKYIGKLAIVPILNREIPVIADEYVSMEFGTGALKITPGHDPNDYDIAQRHNLPILSILDQAAKINENGGPYKGQDRFEAREKLWSDMKRVGLVKDKVEAVCARFPVYR